MEDHMSKFVIEPHFRLQEWVAEEKGYFKDEGLDYVFQELVQKTDGKIHDQGQKVGAYQSLEKGRTSDISCACHWTVNVAASTGKGKLYADVYSVSPSGIFVPPDSPVKHPADLAGVPISVGFQSGSHYSTIQSLEQYLPADKIDLSFNDGLLFKRMELLVDGKVPAAALFSGLGRIPEGGGSLSVTSEGSVQQEFPESYVPIPEHCQGGGCSQFIAPQYTFSSSDPDSNNASMAPPDSKGHSAKDMFAALTISLTAATTRCGMCCPPNSCGQPMPFHPLSANTL